MIYVKMWMAAFAEMKHMYVAGAFMTSLCRKRHWTNNKQTNKKLLNRIYISWYVEILITRKWILV